MKPKKTCLHLSSPSLDVLHLQFNVFDCSSCKSLVVLLHEKVGRSFPGVCLDEGWFQPGREDKKRYDCGSFQLRQWQVSKRVWKFVTMTKHTSHSVKLAGLSSSTRPSHVMRPGRREAQGDSALIHSERLPPSTCVPSYLHDCVQARKQRQMNVWTNRRTEGWTDGPMEGWMKGRTEGRRDGQREREREMYIEVHGYT